MSMCDVRNLLKEVSMEMWSDFVDSQSSSPCYVDPGNARLYLARDLYLGGARCWQRFRAQIFFEFSVRILPQR
jgi:hypothetical protein